MEISWGKLGTCGKGDLGVTYKCGFYLCMDADVDGVTPR